MNSRHVVPIVAFIERRFPLIIALAITTFVGLSWTAYGFVASRIFVQRQPVLNLQLLGLSSGSLINGATTWDQVAEWAASEWNAAGANSQFLKTTPARTVAPCVRGDQLNTVAWYRTACDGLAYGDGTLAVTYSYPRNGDGATTEFEIIVNSNLSWNAYDGPLRSAAGGGILHDLRRILLHELGHTLGLSHPDEAGQFVQAIMNAHESDLSTLTFDDKNGVISLYGTPQTGSPTPLLSQTALTFMGQQGGLNPPSQTISVSNSGGGRLTFVTTASTNRLRISPSFGVAPTTLVVSADFSGLQQGTYNASVEIWPAGSNNTPSVIPVTFNVQAGMPTLTGFTPNIVVAGSGDATVLLTGNNFLRSSVAMLGSLPLVTTFINSTTLSAIIPSAVLSNAGTFPISIVNPPPGGGTSNTVTFYVLGNLTNRVSVGNVAGGQGSDLYYRIAVPAGATRLLVTISGGTGDATLYVRYAQPPTVSTYDCRPFLSGNNESCIFLNPQSGDWFILLRGFSSYANVTLRATYAFAVYRFYNTQTGTHFYTISESEKSFVVQNLPYLAEGIAYYAHAMQAAGTSPVYRFYNTQTGTHFYTISEGEKNFVLQNLPHLAFEGIAFYAEDQ